MDYNLCLIMLPLVLAGSFVGVIISNILPEAVLTIILVVLLVYLTYDSLSKAIGLWKKETIALEKEKQAYKPLAGDKKQAELTSIQRDSGVTPQAPETDATPGSQLIEVTAGSPSGG